MHAKKPVMSLFFIVMAYSLYKRQGGSGEDREIVLNLAFKIV